MVCISLFWHHSEIQLYTTDGNPPVAHTVGYIGGSVPPYTDTNAGLQGGGFGRALTDEALVSDMSVYWADLQVANRAGRADWSAHLTASRDLSLRSLSPHAWWQLAESIRQGGNQTAFTALVVAYRRGFYQNATGIDARQWACTMESDTDAKQAECYRRMGEEVVAPLLSAVSHCDGPSKEEAEEVLATVQLLRVQTQLKAIQQRKRETLSNLLEFATVQ